MAKFNGKKVRKEALAIAQTTVKEAEKRCITSTFLTIGDMFTSNMKAGQDAYEAHIQKRIAEHLKAEGRENDKPIDIANSGLNRNHRIHK